ncbi:unnamed protein product [Mucor circinelloides]
MPHNWCWLEESRCVTFSNIKTKRLYTEGKYITRMLAKNTILLKRDMIAYRYASLFFVAGINQDDNELITLEIIHRYVEILDRYFGNVCELDLIFNFQKAYFILDELLIAGELQETSKKSVLRVITQEDQFEEQEGNEPKAG